MRPGQVRCLGVPDHATVGLGRFGSNTLVPGLGVTFTFVVVFRP